MLMSCMQLNDITGEYWNNIVSKNFVNILMLVAFTISSGKESNWFIIL